MKDTIEDMFPAIRTCTGLADWMAASSAHAAALDGADPKTFATNVCTYNASLSSTKVCEELGP
jgi:hypothetical protein